MSRNSGGRQLLNDSVVIVCEGTETEYPYFKELCKENINIRVVPEVSEVISKKAKSKRTQKSRHLYLPANIQFLGPEYYAGLPEVDAVTYRRYKSEPLRWVRAAQLFQERNKYYEAWAVFDLDKGRQRTFQRAFSMVTSTLQIAFSAYSIEEWFLMHFERNPYPFNYSECKDANKKVINCGNIKCRSTQNCHGTRCLGGYLREKRYIPEYAKNNGKEYAQLTKDRFHVACVNAAWSRYLNRNPPYMCNPYSNVDKLVMRILGCKDDIEWVKMDEVFSIDNNNYRICKRQANIKLLFEGPSALAVIPADHIYWCNDNYENIAPACSGINFNFNTNKDEAIISPVPINTYSKILCITSNGKEVYIDLS